MADQSEPKRQDDIALVWAFRCFAAIAIVPVFLLFPDLKTAAGFPVLFGPIAIFLDAILGIRRMPQRRTRSVRSEAAAVKSSRATERRHRTA